MFNIKLKFLSSFTFVICLYFCINQAFSQATQDTTIILPPNVCGDGILSASEQCDDGNKKSGDGCSSACQVEDGWWCTGGSSTTKDYCIKIIETGTLEECVNFSDLFYNTCDDLTTTEDLGKEYVVNYSSQKTQTSSSQKQTNNTNTTTNTTNTNSTSNTTDTSSDDTVDITIIVVDTNTDTPPATNTSSSSQNNSSQSNSFITTRIPQSFDQMTSEQISCSNVGHCMNQLNSHNKCSWQRKMCLSCRQSNGMTLLRVQTNSYPDHCYQANVNKPIKNEIDFEVAFNPQGLRLPVNDIKYQGQLEELLCQFNSLNDKTLDKIFNYTLNSGNTTGVVGIALNGVPIFAGSSEFNQDAYFPKSTNDNPIMRTINADACLGNNDYTNYYHYYTFSPCILQSPLKNQASINSCADQGGCQGKELTYSSSYLLNSQKKLTIIGVAKDGHYIYGPYNSEGGIWQPCDVDHCNGRYINGKYAYVTTYFHPYTIGCWGPSTDRIYIAQCSKNARVCFYSNAFSLQISYVVVTILAMAVFLLH